MLVYVRESEWGTVMCDVTEQDISDHVRARLKVGPATQGRAAACKHGRAQGDVGDSGEQGCLCGV